MAPGILPPRVSHAGTAINWQAPLNRGLTAWWYILPTMPRGKLWPDLVGRSPGTLTNMSSSATSGWQADRPPGSWGSCAFDASDDSVVIAPKTHLDIGASVDFTCSLWYKSSRGNQGFLWPMIVCYGGGSPQNSFKIISTDGFNETMVFELWVSGTAYKVQPSLDITTGAWRHVVCTRSGSTTAVYCDGLFIAQNTSASSGSLVNTQGMFFGKEGNNSNWVDGRLNDVRLYVGRALSTADVRQLYMASRLGYCQELLWSTPFPIIVQGASGTPVTGSGTATANEALVASSVKARTVTEQGSATRIASSAKAASAHAAASAALKASSVRAGSATEQGSSSRVASSVKARTVTEQAAAARVASSLRAASATAQASATRIASSVRAGTALTQALATKIASSVLARTETAHGTLSAAVTSNLLAPAASHIQASSQRVANELATALGVSHATAALLASSLAQGHAALSVTTTRIASVLTTALAQMHSSLVPLASSVVARTGTAHASSTHVLSAQRLVAEATHAVATTIANSLVQAVAAAVGTSTRQVLTNSQAVSGQMQALAEVLNQAVVHPTGTTQALAALLASSLHAASGTAHASVAVVASELAAALGAMTTTLTAIMSATSLRTIIEQAAAAALASSFRSGGAQSVSSALVQVLTNLLSARLAPLHATPQLQASSVKALTAQMHGVSLCLASSILTRPAVMHAVASTIASSLRAATGHASATSEQTGHAPNTQDYTAHAAAAMQAATLASSVLTSPVLMHAVATTIQSAVRTSPGAMAALASLIRSAATTPSGTLHAAAQKVVSALVTGTGFHAALAASIQSALRAASATTQGSSARQLPHQATTRQAMTAALSTRLVSNVRSALLRTQGTAAPQVLTNLRSGHGHQQAQAAPHIGALSAEHEAAGALDGEAGLLASSLLATPAVTTALAQALVLVVTMLKQAPMTAHVTTQSHTLLSLLLGEESEMAAILRYDEAQTGHTGSLVTLLASSVVRSMVGMQSHASVRGIMEYQNETHIVGPGNRRRQVIQRYHRHQRYSYAYRKRQR